jgi:hypothetical protein
MTCYMVNRSSSIVLKLKTTYEIWFGSYVNYSKLKVFSCSTYVYVKKDKLRSEKGNV